MRKIIINLSFAMIFTISASSIYATTLALPPNLLALASPVGTKIFNRSYSPEYFWPLNLHFVTQENLTYCGIASSVMILNALDIPAPRDSIYAPFKIFTQENFFTPEVKRVLTPVFVKKQGVTLEQLSHALRVFPVTIKMTYANDITIDRFRELAKKVIHTKKGYIIVNFFRARLGQEGKGHMSPLAAYDEKTDRFLILDVSRYRYPPVWIKTQDLWKAMNTLDKDSNKYRGLIVVSKK